MKHSLLLTFLLLSNIGFSQIGQFEFILIDSMATGEPGETIFAYGELVNNSDQDVELLLIKEINDMPDGWNSAICTDICAAPTVDTAYQMLFANTSQSFTMYFYTSDTPNSGHTLMQFLNLNDPSNIFRQDYYGETSALTSVSTIIEKNQLITTLGPNPATDILTVQLDPVKLSNYSDLQYRITNAVGQTLSVAPVTNTVFSVNVGKQAVGFAVLSLYEGDELVAQRKILIR